MEKKYNLIHQFRLETSVAVNGQRVRISFSGGSKFKETRNGHYITRDPEIQKALEADKGYGSQWILDPACVIRNAEEAKSVAAKVDPVPPVDPPAELTGNTGQVPEEPKETGTADCTNFTLAKNYLLALYPETKRPDIISEEKLRAFAATKGITFPEFKK